MRTEHDGSYDRAFVKKLGGVVSIKDGTWSTLWDAEDLDYPYNVVAEKMAKFVREHAIVSAFRHNEPTVGYVETTERTDTGIKTWNHFHAVIPTDYFTREVDTVLGDINTTVTMGLRALTEITPEAVQQVLDLIDADALYRGAEHHTAVSRFALLQQRYLRAREVRKPTLLWENKKDQVLRIRNTAIGTLLTDLSEGVSLETAVAAFEAKVAPTNYKRPTALITPGMVKTAMATIDELGIEPALHRRYAVMSDVSVNDVLWVDGSVRDVMKDGGVAGILATASAPKPKTDKAVDIGIDDFMTEVLSKATAVEVLFKNALQPHLMSLTAPYRDDVPRIFKWGNSFAWSYNGNITDSIKERVKAAGGNVAADLRVSLSWFNYDDLDLHAQCPDGRVYFGSPAGDQYRRWGGNARILDVDMNAGGRQTRTPVENLSWVKPKDGDYKIVVNQYARRETADVGFTVEIECNGTVLQLSYPKAVDRDVPVASFHVQGGFLKDLTLGKGLVHQGLSQVVWGVETEKFVKVKTVLFSPNHWGESTGNKHVFFILDGCTNPEATRGFYNEFLSPAYDKHRKVFEVLGDKMKCQPTEDQLSGLGFSSTKRDSVTVKVTGPKINQLYNVNF